MNATKKVNAILEGKDIRKVISEGIDDAIVKSQATETIHQDIHALHKAAYRLSDIIDDALNLKGVYSPAKICAGDECVTIKFGPTSEADTVLTEETTTSEDIVEVLSDLKEDMDKALEDFDLEVSELELVPAEDSDVEPVKVVVGEDGEVAQAEADPESEDAIPAEDATEEVLAAIADVPEEIVVTLESKCK